MCIRDRCSSSAFLEEEAVDRCLYACVRTGEGLAPRRFSSQNFYVPGVKFRYTFRSRRPSQSCFSWLTCWTRDHVTVLRPDNFEGSVQESNPGPLTLVKLTRVQHSNHSATELHLFLDKHISSVCKSAYYHIRSLHHICSAITDDMAKSVASSLVCSRLDYANSLLFGTTQKKY